ncbi:CobW family GTP-binding protein [Candidatus Contubernalis alkaliaceticus]|uniref:CobW family GTP-binding protein n=1 Tax=Candidatus Contubernalis alkaliaceticus TaxID=338645 RepID=UPI001F4C05DC|nr:CobW family GTP-binding protein [Candidatus Contubernalis alkalaceticus]UNC93140.1 GTP-binding protein [Candidatus Contubernalis alkalaceticus]
MKKQIKLYLLTGFLGAGKTTFLMKVLEELKDQKVAVIMNEFGKVGIDGEIIRKDDLKLVEINRGSIFCSCLELSFVSALLEMVEQDMDYVFVESSGLADPSNIGEFLRLVEKRKGQVYDYSGAICIVDGVQFPEQLIEIETVERQLRFCHLVILTKTDLISKQQKEDVILKIKQVNSKVDIIESENGVYKKSFLDENLMASTWVETEDTTNTPENKPKTLTLTFDSPVSQDDFTKFLKVFQKDIYRMKGFINFETGWKQVDVVGSIIDFKDSEEKAQGSHFVIISKVGFQIVKPIFAAWEETFNIPMKLR